MRAPAWSVELQQSLEKILLHKQIEFKGKQMLLVKTAFLSGSVEWFGSLSLVFSFSFGMCSMASDSATENPFTGFSSLSNSF